MPDPKFARSEMTFPQAVIPPGLLLSMIFAQKPLADAARESRPFRITPQCCVLSSELRVRKDQKLLVLALLRFGSEEALDRHRMIRDS
jgi:hypothetical protein